MTLTVQQKLIRDHTRRLLGKEAKDPPSCDVTEAEAEGFDSSVGYPCTAQNFRLYLAGTPAHKWNQAAAEVFTKSLLEERPELGHDRVKRFFITHLRSLISAFKKRGRLQGMSEREREKTKGDIAAQARRNTQKHNVGSIITALHSQLLRIPTALPSPYRGRQNDRRF